MAESIVVLRRNGVKYGNNNKDSIDVSVSSNTETKASTETPNTEDSANMDFYGAVAMLSFAGVGVCASALYRRKYSDR